MKLKEKMADAYIKQTGMVIDSPVLADYLEAKEYYLAGFEAARQLALQSQCDQWHAIHVHHDCENLQKLGDEEVGE